jgi:DNA repair protein RadA/Sms
MKCSLCDFFLPKDKLRCPNCHHWNLRAEESDDDTVLLSDAKVENVERIDVGFFNPIFGKGGLARTSVNLVGGPPGGGKTTMFLMMCDLVIPKFEPHEGLYIACEQSDAEIRDYALRLKIQSMHRIRIVKAMGGLKRDLGELIAQFNPCLMILDSLSKLCGENLELQVKVAERMKEYTVQYKAPSLIVNQITKQDDHAGLMKLQHAVDATFMMDKDDSDGSRFLYSTKNRFGAAPVGIELMMTPENAEIPGILVPKGDTHE